MREGGGEGEEREGGKEGGNLCLWSNVSCLLLLSRFIFPSLRQRGGCRGHTLWILTREKALIPLSLSLSLTTSFCLPSLLFSLRHSPSTSPPASCCPCCTPSLPLPSHLNLCIPPPVHTVYLHLVSPTIPINTPIKEERAKATEMKQWKIRPQKACNEIKLKNGSEKNEVRNDGNPQIKLRKFTENAFHHSAQRVTHSSPKNASLPSFWERTVWGWKS